MAPRPNQSLQTRTLLRALLDQPLAWRHGYELSKATKLQSGTLYPLLIRLSDQGFLESKWVEPTQPGKPPRHVYRLTAAGKALARSFDSATEKLTVATGKWARRPG
ncbi:MAG: PadR family transcriptional regulator [Rhizomicrobium sp.]